MVWLFKQKKRKQAEHADAIAADRAECSYPLSAHVSEYSYVDGGRRLTGYHRKSGGTFVPAEAPAKTNSG